MTRSSLRNAALTCATQWQWPVLPGVALPSPAPASPGRPEPEPHEGPESTEHTADSGQYTARTVAAAGAVGGPDGEARAGAVAGPAEGDGPADRPSRPCSCPDPGCVVPGAHPSDPVLLAATTDARMVRWWWTNRPAASLILATGGRAPCALSLPAVAGARALAEFDRCAIRLGPVTATSTRFTFLVSPYVLEELGDLLYTQDRVPSSLRFHGEGGYITLPPSCTGAGQVRWVRPPVAERGAGGAPWLPRMEPLLDALVEASATTPDTGTTLAY